MRGTCRPCMNSVSLSDRLVRLKQAPQTSECIIDTRTNLVYQSSVCQLCISRLLNCHPVNKLALTYHAYPVLYGHLYRYLRTYLALITDISTAANGHIHRSFRKYPSLLSTYGHLYRYLRIPLPLLTDISTAIYGHIDIYRYLRTYSALVSIC